MPDQTPLEKLDDALHAYFEETGTEDGRFLTGWIIGMSTARITADDEQSIPLVTGAQYSIGPQTSTTDAAGIVRFLEVVMERAHWQMLNAGEGADDE